MAQTETFGEFLRARRVRAGFGLRAFAEAAGMQPSNLSNLEHGRLAPPQDGTTLEALAELLGLARDDEDWARMFDLAVAGRERLPADVASFAVRTPLTIWKPFLRIRSFAMVEPSGSRAAGLDSMVTSTV